MRRIYDDFLGLIGFLFLLIKLSEFLSILLHTYNRNVSLDLVLDLRCLFLLGYNVGWLCLFGSDWSDQMERVA